MAQLLKEHETLVWFGVCFVALLISIGVEVPTLGKNSRAAAVLRAVVAAIVVPVVFYAITQIWEGPTRREADEKEERKILLLTELVARAGSPEAAAELIKLRTDAVVGHSPDPETFAEELIRELPKRVEQFTALQRTKKEEANRLILLWEPIVRAALREFDDRLAAVTRRGVNVKITTEDVSIIDPVGTFRGARNVRGVEFENEYRLTFYVLPGAVEPGQPVREPVVSIEGRAKEGASRLFMGINFQDEKVSWTLPALSPERQFESLPIDAASSKLPEAISSGVSSAIEFAVLTTRTAPTDSK